MRKKIGSGYTADVYAYEGGKVCKLFRERYSIDAIRREYENAKVMEEANLPVPRCYGIIQEGERTGILYEKITGVSILGQFLQKGNYIWMLENFVNLHKRILECHSDQVMDYKDFLRWSISKNENDRERILEKINRFPDDNTICHGDYHPDNVMVSPEGDIRVIDFMNVCHGPRLYDIARTYFLITFGSLPEEYDANDDMNQMRNQLGEDYLRKIGVKKADITEFLEVIRICRKGEQ